MPTPTLTDLLSDKTKEQVFDELVQAAIDEKLSSTAWQPGEPIRAIMSAVARVLAALWTVLAVPAIRAAFLDYASGAWLTLLAWTAYNVKRKGKEFAAGNITIENRGGVAYLGGGSIVPGQIRIKNEVTGKTFTNVGGGGVEAWINSGPYPTVTLPFIADEAGIGSDTLPDEISTQPVTAPSGLVVKSPTPAMLGSDEETDDALKERCRLSTAVISPAGPRDAYRFVALSTLRADGSYVSVTRVRVVDTGACTLRVYLAGRSAPTPGDMATAGSDVFLVYQRLLKDVVPTGFVCHVYSAIAEDTLPTLAQTLTVNLIVDADSGLTKEEAEAKASAAIAEYIADVPIGGRRDEPIVSFDDPGKLMVSELLAKASESAKGIVRATSSLGTADMEIPFNAIPDIAYSVTAVLVKQ